jgi:hypothetical protein
MKTWILTALILVLAMVAGDAMADEQVVGANSSNIRRIMISDGFGNHMELTLLTESSYPTPDHPLAPEIFATSMHVGGVVPANTVSAWTPNDACGTGLPCWDLDRNLWVYVLYLKVGRDKERAVLVLQPEMNSFNVFLGSFSTKAYLADITKRDENETDAWPYPWGHRVMSEEVGIRLQRAFFGGDDNPPYFNLEGTLPPVPEK